MSLSRLPLSYCTNVHPGRSVAEVLDGLEHCTARVRERLRRPLAAGLWLARPVVTELLASADGIDRFAARIADLELTCHTLNAFPYGDFHGERVKEKVYLPDWTTPERTRYTLDCAAILARLLETSTFLDPRPPTFDPRPSGSISTLPLGFKPASRSMDFVDRCIDRLLETAIGLNRLREETGRTIRLAIEPEPLCVLETTDETLAFFERLWVRAGDDGDPGMLDKAREHLGLCYDVCHQAVEFEDTAASLRRLDAAGVRIAKVHITCAIRLENPGDSSAARGALADFAEPRYLHQLTALTESGNILRQVDLTREFALDPPPEFHAAREWRVHFHVPVDAEGLGQVAAGDQEFPGLRTTRTDLRAALEAVAGLGQSPHLEVETYTWSVLPGAERVDLVDGLTREIEATERLFSKIPSDR